MARTRAKVDTNQVEIVKALRAAGRSVLVLSAVGKGCPDILVGHKDGNILLELKSMEKWKLTPDQQRFFAEWRGPAAVVCSVEQALCACGIHTGNCH